MLLRRKLRYLTIITVIIVKDDRTLMAMRSNILLLLLLLLRLLLLAPLITMTSQRSKKSLRPRLMRQRSSAVFARWKEQEKTPVRL